LQACEVRVEIGHLKALLKELNFNWNGPACSIGQLFNALKEYLNPHHATQSFHASKNLALEAAASGNRSQKTAYVGEKFQYPLD